MPLILSLITGTLGSMAAKLMTGAMVEWLVLWAAEIAVKSTRTTHDDKLLERVKEALDG